MRGRGAYKDRISNNSFQGLGIEFLKNTYGALIDIIDTPALPYSSTVIRENLKNGVSVEKMINPAVYDYIMKHGLYGVKSSKLEE